MTDSVAKTPSVDQPTQLSANDSLWLNMDSPENPMVIESVMWFHHRLDPDRVREEVQRKVIDKYPVFSWKPKTSSIPGTRDEWVVDPDFSIDRHVWEVELPGAGGRAELQAFLEERFSEPMPKDRPLWHSQIVQGKEFGALVSRYHHAIADGTALARILIEMTDDEPDPTAPEQSLPGPEETHPADAPLDVDEEGPEPQRRRKRDIAARTVAQAATLPLAAGVKATSGAHRLLEMLDLDRPGSPVAAIADQSAAVADTVDKLLVSQPPDVALFGRTGLHKRADWAPATNLAAVKRAAGTRNATINDLMLAAVAGALRKYLERNGQTPRDVMTMIPVNLRSPFEPLPAHLGNKFALIALMLPVGVEGAENRLIAARDRMNLVKSGPEALLTFGVQNALGMVGTISPTVSRTAQSYFADKSIGVTTNVPGPQNPRYFAGQQLAGILGWVPGASHQAIGVCIFSYNKEIRVGFKTDTQVVPDIANLVDAYNEELEKLLALGDSAPE